MRSVWNESGRKWRQKDWKDRCWGEDEGLRQCVCSKKRIHVLAFQRFHLVVWSYSTIGAEGLLQVKRSHFSELLTIFWLRASHMWLPVLILKEVSSNKQHRSGSVGTRAQFLSVHKTLDKSVLLLQLLFLYLQTGWDSKIIRHDLEQHS